MTQESPTSSPSDASDPEVFIAEVDGQPHLFAIEEQMTQTTPVLHEEVVVDLGPVDLKDLDDT